MIKLTTLQIIALRKQELAAMKIRLEAFRMEGLRYA